MNREMLEKAGINYDEGLKRFSGNVALYEKFLNKFLADETFLECKTAICNGDYAKVETVVHTLKGVTGNLSMNSLHRKCAIVVENLRKGEFFEVDEQFAELEIVYDQIVKALLAE